MVASIAALGVNDYILRPKGKRVHLATYVVLQVSRFGCLETGGI